MQTVLVQLQERIFSMSSRTRFWNFIKENVSITASVKILPVVLGIAFCICLDTWNQLPFLWNSERGRVPVYYYIFNSFTYGGQFVPYLIPALSAIIGTTNYCREHKSGADLYLIGHMGSCRRYALSKIILSVFWSVTVTVTGILLFIAIASCLQPLYSTDFNLETQAFPYFTLLIHHGGIGYFAVILYLSALQAILWNMLALLCSAYFKNIYITIACPLLFSYLLGRIMIYFNVPNDYRIDFWLCARSSYQSDSKTLVLCTLTVLAVSVFCSILFIRKINFQKQKEKGEK